MYLPVIGNIAESGTHLRHSGNHYEAQRITQKRGRAVKLDSAAKQVTLDDGSVLGYDRLLICTGSSPATPPRRPTSPAMESVKGASLRSSKAAPKTVSTRA